MGWRVDDRLVSGRCSRSVGDARPVSEDARSLSLPKPRPSGPTLARDPAATSAAEPWTTGSSPDSSDRSSRNGPQNDGAGPARSGVSRGVASGRRVSGRCSRSVGDARPVSEGARSLSLPKPRPSGPTLARDPAATSAAEPWTTGSSPDSSDRSSRNGPQNDGAGPARSGVSRGVASGRRVSGRCSRSVGDARPVSEGARSLSLPKPRPSGPTLARDPAATSAAEPWTTGSSPDSSDRSSRNGPQNDGRGRGPARNGPQNDGAGPRACTQRSSE